jgi:pimeloyl-ACP methyl ester carboxylesterase
MKRVFAFAFCLLLAACASRTEKAQHLAQDAGWQWQVQHVEPFDIATATRLTQSPVLWVYIEGDGLAFINPHTPAQDPTPVNPVALRMAITHPQDVSVAYLARPCQYGLKKNCDASYWTNARYSDEVIDALNEAVTVLKTQAHATDIKLVGYSGGGALAVLVAARRTDVKAIVTVGANLDLGYWTSANHLTPLDRSRDPADVAAQLATVPQIHFMGGEDHVVGSDVTRAYLAKLPAHAPARLVEVPGYSHYCCWDKDWPTRMQGNF